MRKGKAPQPAHRAKGQAKGQAKEDILGLLSLLVQALDISRKRTEGRYVLESVGFVGVIVGIVMFAMVSMHARWSNALQEWRADKEKEAEERFRQQAGDTNQLTRDQDLRTLTTDLGARRTAIGQETKALENWYDTVLVFTQVVVVVALFVLVTQLVIDDQGLVTHKRAAAVTLFVIAVLSVATSLRLFDDQDDREKAMNNSLQLLACAVTGVVVVVFYDQVGAPPSVARVAIAMFSLWVGYLVAYLLHTVVDNHLPGDSTDWEMPLFVVSAALLLGVIALFVHAMSNYLGANPLMGVVWYIAAIALNKVSGAGVLVSSLVALVPVFPLASSIVRI